MTQPSAERSLIDPLDVVAEEFVRRFREGERPSLSEYAVRYPELAERIGELFPALVRMEEAGSIVGPLAAMARLAPRVDDQIGEFRILRKIGAGGMGLVYEAVQESLGRHVALKVLTVQRDRIYLERFRREARTAARLHHTNIVPVFAVGETAGIHYYVMQFIHGQGLDTVLRAVRVLRTPETDAASDSSTAATSVAKSLHDGNFVRAMTEGGEPSVVVTSDASGGDLPIRSELLYYREVARLGAQAAEALAYAHSQGVLHRDVKPSNLLLDTHGTLWITDFGLAKADDSDDLTKTGDLVGTLRYMPPERIRGRADARSDVYSLGATLYEMLTLRPAFPQSDRLELIERIGREAPPPLRRHEPRIPRDLETIVLKAIARDPADRYRTAADLAEDLRRFLNDLPVRARRITWAEELWRWSRRNRTIAGLAASVVLLLAVLAAGASLLAYKTGQSRDQARRAELERTQQLAQSLLSQARAARSSRRRGQRFQGLAAIRSAQLLARESGEPESFQDKLRTEAIACLALPDISAPVDDSALRPLPANLMAVSPTVYVVLDTAGFVQVTRTQDQQVLARWQFYPGHPIGRLSHDGSIVAIRSDSGAFRAWNLTTNSAVPLLDRAAGVRAHDIRLDGQELALGLENGTVVLWDIADQATSLLFVPGGPAADLAYSPDGQRLAVVGADTIRVVDCRMSRVVASLKQPSRIASVSWATDNRRMAVGCADLEIILWDVNSSRELHRLPSRSDNGSVAYTPGGELLLSSGWDGMLRVWDPDGRQQRLGFYAAPHFRLSRDGRIWIGAPGRPVAQVELATGQEYQTLERLHLPDLKIATIAAHPGGRILAAAFHRGIALYDMATGQLAASLPGSCYRLTFDGNGDLIAHGQSGLFHWPIRSTSEANLVVGPPARIEAPEPDGIMAIGCSRDGRVIAGTFQGGPAVLHRDHPDHVTWLGRQMAVRTVAVSPDGVWVAAGSWDTGEGLWIYSAATGRPETRLEARSEVSAVFSPDGRYLVVGSKATSQKIVRVETWNVVAEVAGLAVAFTGDGRLMAVAGEDGPIRLLELETMRELARLEPPDPDRAYWMAFAPDGSRLAVAYSLDKSITVWDLGRIRRQLAEMNLDWQAPPIAEEPVPARPLVIRVVGAARTEPAIEYVLDLAMWGLAALKNPLAAEPHERLGWAFARHGAANKALSEFDRAVKLRPEHAPTYFRRGLTRLEVRTDFDRAAADFGKALELEPGWIGARLNRAKCLARACHWSSALADADAILAAQPWNADASLIRARSLRNFKRHREAMAELDAAISTYPFRALLYLWRSASRRAVGYDPGSAADLTRYFQLVPPEYANYDAWRLLTGPAAVRDYEQAELIARCVIERAPRQAHFHNTLGLAFYRLGRFEEAE
ncbi:MAG TPA: protein kinase, partial [Isosphaeraceae bacterium]|nr:protein kinase [Isosphaeraceae bacterium]